MKNILAATDLSPAAALAIGRAAELTSRFDAALTVLHVVDEGLPEAIAAGVRAQAEEAIRGQLAAISAPAARTARIQVVVGEPYGAILDWAWTPRADLLVMGMHRKAPMRDLFRGTTVDRVLRRGDVPTLVVRDEPVASYRRILIGVDFSVAARRALEFALRLAPDAEFHVLHAYEVPFAGYLTDPRTHEQVKTEHDEQLDKLVRQELETCVGRSPELGARCRLILSRGETRAALSWAIGEVQPDLLALGTHGRTGISRALLGSVAEEVLANPPCDVVAVKGW